MHSRVFTSCLGVSVFGFDVVCKRLGFGLVVVVVVMVAVILFSDKVHLVHVSALGASLNRAILRYLGQVRSQFTTAKLPAEANGERVNVQ